MKIVVLGAGESGVGAALLAKKENHEVFVSDFGNIPEHFRQELVDNKISFEERVHSFDIIGKSDLIIKSPGISESAKVIQFIRGHEIPLISEIEFASRYCNGKIVAITGSNGKTTTTELTFHVLQEAGVKAVKAGNIGYSFARAIIGKEAGVYVLEISSFQLDDIDQFRADIAVLLNITPDHLDRYGYSLDAYANAKFKIAENQGATDYFIFNQADQLILKRIKNQSWIQNLVRVDYPNNNKIDTKVSGSEIDMTKVNLKGRHNMLNATVAIRIAEILGVQIEQIQRGLETFENVAHRMELIARINGVKYINDSKATNVDAVFFALESMKEPVVWVAGGTDKGNDYKALDQLASEKIKALICLGVDNQKLKTHFESIIPEIRETQDVEEAIQLAEDIAKEGWTVLLSPACASFDLFNNYMDRGDQFKKAVWQLIEA
jgi:UDP-N-acetylmuramoylalanine--D-glutamate ligase